MYKIIVFAYGSLAENPVRILQLIPDGQPDIGTYCVKPGYNLEEMKNGVEQSIRRPDAPDREVLVLTDLIYGTPFNTMIQLEEEYSFTHIAGTNLPLLIEAINRRLMDGSGGNSGGLADIAREGIVDSRVLLRMSRYPRAATQERSKSI